MTDKTEPGHDSRPPKVAWVAPRLKKADVKRETQALGRRNTDGAPSLHLLS